MNTLTAEQVLEALKAPFEPSEIHWRVGSTNAKSVRRKTGNNNARPTKGIALAYLNSRDVMKRLDLIMGIDGWTNHYPFAGCCEISLCIEGQWITKSNTAGETQVEGVKGQGSDAFKRAATMFGVGRYLYYLPNEWVDLDEYGKIKNTPALPKWAMPKPKETE